MDAEMACMIIAASASSLAASGARLTNGGGRSFNYSSYTLASCMTLRHLDTIYERESRAAW